ncbi:MAG: helix-turn-helix domain-containing protein [Chloroflexi bacterium]|nr:helix-turn-helix domain-containing protein [Chloroflexota bacterium]
MRVRVLGLSEGENGPPMVLLGLEVADQADEQTVELPPSGPRLVSATFDLWRDEAAGLFAGAGSRVPLQPLDYRLLVELVAHPGQLLLQRELLARVWGSEFEGAVELLHRAVHRVRKALGSDSADMIQTRHGLGYVFEPEPKAN